MQIGFTIALLIASPIWLYQIFAFLVPGLTQQGEEVHLRLLLHRGAAVPRRRRRPAGSSSRTWSRCSPWFAPPEDAILLDARYYYDFIIKLVLAVGVAFVLPVFLVLLNFIGVLSAKSILKGWRVAVLVITLFCAIATPSVDVVSMFLLAVPMVVLYFAAVGVAYLHDRRVARRASGARGLDPVAAAACAAP